MCCEGEGEEEVAERDMDGNGLPIHPLEMDGLVASFFLMVDSGLPMRFSSDLANLAFARRWVGVWACGRGVRSCSRLLSGG